MVELEDGRVFVQIKSKRGTGTRDQDEITVHALFSNIDQARKQSPELNEIVRKRMADARTVDDQPEVRNHPESEDASSGEQSGRYSKVYLGDGSRMNGWIPVDRKVVFEKIAPLVSRNIVENEDTLHIKVNFSKDVPLSGWKKVDAYTVSEKIEPLVREHRLDY